MLYIKIAKGDIMLILNLEQKEECLHARLVGSLTKNTTYKVYQYVIPYMKQKNIKSFICDCKSLRRIDFDGKGALLKIKLYLKKQKGNFLLCNVKDTMKQELIGYRMRIQS